MVVRSKDKGSFARYQMHYSFRGNVLVCGGTREETHFQPPPGLLEENFMTRLKDATKGLKSKEIPQALSEWC